MIEPIEKNEEQNLIEAYREMRAIYPNDFLILFNPKTYFGYDPSTGKRIKLSVEWVDSNEAHPSITQDEKIILRNISDQYDRVGRKLGGALYLKMSEKNEIDSTFEDFFGNLFQFIKERRRIRDSRTIERRIKQ